MKKNKSPWRKGFKNMSTKIYTRDHKDTKSLYASERVTGKRMYKDLLCKNKFRSSEVMDNESLTQR